MSLRVADHTPDGIDLVPVPCDQTRYRLPEAMVGVVKLATTECQHALQRLDHRPTPLAPMFEADQQRLDRLGYPAQIGTQRVIGNARDLRRKKFVVAQIGPSQLQAPLEIDGSGSALIAFCG